MLIDINIFIEIARAQDKSQECRDLFTAICEDLFKEDAYITSFGLSAIQAMTNQSNPDFLKELMIAIHQEKFLIFDTSIIDQMMILSVQQDLNLDFDDTLHYIAAHKLNTYLVSYDKDFAKHEIIVKTPKKVLKEILS